MFLFLPCAVEADRLQPQKQGQGLDQDKENLRSDNELRKREKKEREKKKEINCNTRKLEGDASLWLPHVQRPSSSPSTPTGCHRGDSLKGQDTNTGNYQPTKLAR